MRSLTVLLMVGAVLASSGCDVVDPARHTTQPDAEVFGNLLDVERSVGDPVSWTVRIKVGTPRSVRSADEDVGKPTPEVDKGLIATVTVGPDAIVMVGDRPGMLENIPSGTEVAVLPVPGSTEMYGSNDLRIEAATIMDFATYRLWRLPKLVTGAEDELDDPSLINSAGSEIAPIPVGDGSVLYFSAHLRPPATPDDTWHGALRDGLTVPTEGSNAVERSYRTQVLDDGWSVPELVRFPGLDEARQIRVTWVAADETACLVTVVIPGGASWVGRATRRGVDTEWSEPQRLDSLGDDARDAAYLTGSTSKIVFVAVREGGSQSDLFLFDPKIAGSPAPLEPPIFTSSSEWSPRTGPSGELLFVRGDRQLLFKDHQVRALRLPGPHRVPFTQAATSDDGSWLFFCVPKFRVPEMDNDIYVAGLSGDFSIGEPVPIDEWRR